jgi:hypothetical protein
MASDVKKLCEQRVELLRKAVKLMEARIAGGQGSLNEHLKILARLSEAELILAATPAERIAVHQANLKRVCKVDKMITAWVKAGTAFPVDQLLSRAACLSAEIDLRQAGGAPPKDARPASDD